MQPETPEPTHSVVLTKVPLGVGWTLDGRNVITTIRHDSQVSRAGNIIEGDQVLSINGVSPEAAEAFPIGTTMHVQLISAAVLCKQRAFGPSSSASPAGPATSLLETREQPGSVLPAAQPFEWPTPDPPSPPIHEKSSPISQSLKSATVVTAGSVVISGHARKLPAAAAATGRSHAKRQLMANAYAGIGGDDGRMNVDEPGPKPAQVLHPSQPAPTSRAAQLQWLERERGGGPSESSFDDGYDPTDELDGSTRVYSALV